MFDTRGKVKQILNGMSLLAAAATSVASAQDIGKNPNPDPTLELQRKPIVVIVDRPVDSDFLNAPRIRPGADLKISQISTNFPVELSSALTNLVNLKKELFELRATKNMDQAIPLATAPEDVQKLFKGIQVCATTLDAEAKKLSDPNLQNTRPANSKIPDLDMQKINSTVKVFYSFIDPKDPSNSSIDAKKCAQLDFAMTSVFRAFAPQAKDRT